MLSRIKKLDTLPAGKTQSYSLVVRAVASISSKLLAEDGRPVVAGHLVAESREGAKAFKKRLINPSFNRGG